MIFICGLTPRLLAEITSVPMEVSKVLSGPSSRPGNFDELVERDVWIELHWEDLASDRRDALTFSESSSERSQFFLGLSCLRYCSPTALSLY